MFDENIGRYRFSLESGLELITKFKCEVTLLGPIASYRTKLIANFEPLVIGVIEESNNGTILCYADVKLKFMDDSVSEPYTVPLKGLGKIDWSEIDSRCALNPDFAKAGEHIAAMIRFGCDDVPVGKATVVEDRLGTHIVEHIPVFHAGDRLIFPNGLLDTENMPRIIWKPIPGVSLVVDPNCTEAVADAGMMRIIGLSNDTGRILQAFNVMNVTREAFSIAGVTPRCSTFVYGTTGFKKTTTAGLMTQLHNRDKLLEHPPRLNASIAAAVRLLYEKADCVTILDDLFPTDSREFKRKQEELLIEITRVVGDGVPPARVRGKQVVKDPPRCGVLFTGEYYTGGGSSGARLLPVKLTAPIDSERLTICQNEPLVLSTFYNNFIEWYIDNFDKICELLKEWRKAYRSVKSNIHPRLEETQFCFEAAYKLFLTYRAEKGFITRDEMLEDYHSFYQQLRSIVTEQDARIKQQNVSGEPIDYLALIRTIYREKRFKLADGPKNFDKDEHDGIGHKDHVYLRKDKLMKRIKAVEPTAEFDEVVAYLKSQNALKMNKGSSSRQINGCGGLRFYAIKICML